MHTVQNPCLLLDLLLSLDLEQTLSLLCQTRGLALAHSLVLDTTSLHLFLDVLGSDFLSLGAVNVFHEDTLVLEAVTLGFEIECVVAERASANEPVTGRESYSQMLVDLSSLPVLFQESPENPHSPQPLDLGGHTGLGGTLSFTESSVSSESLGSLEFPGTGTRVDDGGFDDTAACKHTAEIAGVGALTCDHP